MERHRRANDQETQKLYCRILVRCLESSVTDFGNIFHFRKDRPTALNSNIQIPNSKQSANPNFQNPKQKHSEGSVLVLHTFLFWSFVFVWSLVIEIWNFRVSGKWIKYGTFFPNFKLPFLGTELMRRGTRLKVILPRAPPLVFADQRRGALIQRVVSSSSARHNACQRSP